jgi:tRNA G37 N-methylase TrmD
MNPMVCVLNEEDARSFSSNSIAQKCSSRRHHHYTKGKVNTLIKTGELVWVGKHKNVATFRNARSWIKVYTYNEFGEVIYCGMQLVPGGGVF